jgi:glycosyltransferase involved in cell wall biosynthesis
MMSSSLSSDPPVADVSVIVAAYNRAALIPRTLGSIAAQTLRPAAVIVVDDGSRDETSAVAESWQPPEGTTLQLIRHPHNQGVAETRNSGMRAARTKYLAFLDSDDCWHPGALARLVPPLERHEDAVLCCADAEVDGVVAGRPPTLLLPRLAPPDLAPVAGGDEGLMEFTDPVSLLLTTSMIPTCSAVFRRKDAFAAELMPDFRTGEDWLFWLRLAHRGRFLCRTEPIATVLRHAGNLTDQRHAAFTAREHLRALIALRDGTLGLELNPAHRARIVAAVEEKSAHWRYHLSRGGLRAYWRGLGSAEGSATGGRIAHLTADPRSLIRAMASLDR